MQDVNTQVQDVNTQVQIVNTQVQYSKVAAPGERRVGGPMRKLRLAATITSKGPNKQEAWLHNRTGTTLHNDLSRREQRL